MLEMTFTLLWTTLISIFIAAGCLVYFLKNERKTKTLEIFFQKIIFLYLRKTFEFFLNAILSPSCKSAFHDFYFYLCKTNNPIVQIFYLAILVGGYLAFVLSAYPWIPNPYLSGFHKIIGFLVICFCLISFAFCSFSNPGIITKENEKEHEKIYKYDSKIFFKNKICPTCYVIKAARSKHCSLCNVCVYRFDHHCVWIGNCVGGNNYKLFLCFLILNMLMCLYGSILGLSVIFGIIDYKNLMSATFVDHNTGWKSKASFSLILQYLLVHHSMVIFLFVLTFVIFFVLLFFSLWNVYMAFFRNITTNELFKYRMARLENKEMLDSNLEDFYNNGLSKNAQEVFFWEKWKESVIKSKTEIKDKSKITKKTRKRE